MVIQALACSARCLEAWLIDALLKGLCDHAFGLKGLKIIILAQCHRHSLVGSTTGEIIMISLPRNASCVHLSLIHKADVCLLLYIASAFTRVSSNP